MPRDIIITIMLYGIVTVVFISLAVYVFLYKSNRYAPLSDTKFSRTCESFTSEKEKAINANIIDYMIDKDSNKRLIVIQDTYKVFMIICRPEMPSSLSSLVEVLTSKTQFGFNSSAAMFVFDILCKCYDIDARIAFPRRTISASVTSPKTQNMGFDVYCMMFLDKPVEPFIHELDRIAFTVVDYENVPRDKLSFFLPFVKFKGIDMRLLLPRKDSFVTIYMSIVLDEVVYAYQPFENDFKKAFDYYGGNDRIDVQQVYNIYFAFFEPIKRGLFHQENIENIEYFEQAEQAESADFYIDQTINGTLHINHANMYKYFVTSDKKLVDHSILKLGDKLVLRGQINETENDTFVITSRNDRRIVLEKGYATSFAQSGFMDAYKVNGHMIVTSKTFIGPPLIPNDTIFFSDLEIAGYVVFRNGTNIRVAIIKRDENKERAICISNPELLTRPACESLYDVYGGKKKHVDVWDAPCQKDSDCPFYMRNKNYKNTRGACHNGFCEMPTGVTRVGYTKFIDKPFCHGCPSYLNPTCCSNQGAADYAFSFDWLARADAYQQSQPLQNISI